MAIKFFRGPYDGKEADHTAINQHATIIPVNGEVGPRVFVLMPPPESWDRLLRGESAENAPLYPYERVMNSEGARFEWAPSGLEHAMLEAKLKVHPRARTALSTLSSENRNEIIGFVAGLQKLTPDEWKNRGVVRVADDKNVYLVKLTGALVAFVRVLDTDELELFDIVREDTIRQFVQRYVKVGAPG